MFFGVGAEQLGDHGDRRQRNKMHGLDADERRPAIIGGEQGLIGVAGILIGDVADRLPLELRKQECMEPIT